MMSVLVWWSVDTVRNVKDRLHMCVYLYMEVNLRFHEGIGVTTIPTISE